MTGLGVSAYDEIAGMYHALWANWYLPAAMPALEKLFFSQVPAGARVLDLCCGSGHVTKELLSRGYAVTGIDSSAGLIDLARKELPGADLRVQDARALQLDGGYNAAISTFDSLNHMLNINDLRTVFVEVHRLLEAGGLFVFDMNLEEAYSTDLRQWNVNIDDHNVGLVRATYDFVSKKAETELVWFLRSGENNCWRQHRSLVEQRCYSESEILLALTRSGFKKVEVIPATDVGVNADLGFGRIFFAASPQE